MSTGRHLWSWANFDAKSYFCFFCGYMTAKENVIGFLKTQKCPERIAPDLWKDEWMRRQLIAETIYG